MPPGHAIHRKSLSVGYGFFLSDHFLHLFNVGSQRPSNRRHRATSRVGSKVLFYRSNKNASGNDPRPNRRLRTKTTFYRPTLERHRHRTTKTLTISKQTSVSQNVHLPRRLRSLRHSIITTSNLHHKTSIRAIKRCRVGGRTRNRTKRRRRTRLIMTFHIIPPRRHYSHHRRRGPTTVQRGRPLVRKSRIISKTISSMLQINSNRIRPRGPSRVRRPVYLGPRVQLRTKTRQTYVRMFSPVVLVPRQSVLSWYTMLHG